MIPCVAQDYFIGRVLILYWWLTNYAEEWLLKTFFCIVYENTAILFSLSKCSSRDLGVWGLLKFNHVELDLTRLKFADVSPTFFHKAEKVVKGDKNYRYIVGWSPDCRRFKNSVDSYSTQRVIVWGLITNLLRCTFT